MRHIPSAVLYNMSMYRIAGNFRGRKLSQIVTFAVPKDTVPPNFVEKTVVNSHKTAKFAKVFSLKSFPLYSISRSTLYP